MIVTRQTNYYDNGAFSVEIAAELDYAGPGALVRNFPQDFAESDDPREIAELAIKLRKNWTAHLRSWEASTGEERREYIPFTLSMNGFAYATVEDGLTAAGLRRWAKAKYEKIPKCEYCGGIGAKNYITPWSEEVLACCDSHAEMLDTHEYEEEYDSPGFGI